VSAPHRPDWLWDDCHGSSITIEEAHHIKAYIEHLEASLAAREEYIAELERGIRSLEAALEVCAEQRHEAEGEE